MGKCKESLHTLPLSIHSNHTVLVSPVTVDYNYEHRRICNHTAEQTRESFLEEVVLGLTLTLSQEKDSAWEEEELQALRVAAGRMCLFTYPLVHYHFQHPSCYLLWQQLCVAYPIPTSLRNEWERETVASLPASRWGAWRRLPKRKEVCRSFLLSPSWGLEGACAGQSTSNPLGQRQREHGGSGGRSWELLGNVMTPLASATSFM